MSARWATRIAEDDADLDLWARIRTAASPRERLVKPLRLPTRLLLLADEIGCARSSPSELKGTASVDVFVMPEMRARGVGSVLFERCLDHARGLRAGWVGATVDELNEHGRAFAASRGFVEVDREVEMRRTIAAEPVPEPLPGLEVVSLAERPELLEAAYETVAVEAYRDMPLPASFVSSYEKWLEAEGSGVPEGSFVALDQGEIVGYAGMQSHAEHGLTAVRRSHRGRGIATQLKRHQLAWAAAAGVTELVTFTQGRNTAMQHVNERLGYVAQPAWLKLRAPLTR